MLKRKWSPLSPQIRIAEALNAAPTGMSLVALQACDYLSDLSAHAIAVNVGLLAKRGEVNDYPGLGTRVFALTDQGKLNLDIHRMARSRLARRLRMQIPEGTYPDALPPDDASAGAAPSNTQRGVDGGRVAVTPPEPMTLPTPGRLERPENREEVIAKPLTSTATISRQHLRLLVTRALSAPAPLTDADRSAITAAILEAA